MSAYQIIVLVLRWLILALGVWVAAELVGGITYNGWKSILIVAAVLGLINMYIKPVITLLSLPFAILTLGLFLIVLNALFLGLASWISGELGVDFHVDDFWAALFGAIIISIVGIVVGLFISPERIARDLTGR